MAVKLTQLDIGDRAPTVESFKTISDLDLDEIILDVMAAYRGNAVASGSVNLNRLEIPVNLSRFFVTNMKLRIIVKGIVPRIPIISGVQIFLLEAPKIDWSSNFAAKVTIPTIFISKCLSRLSIRSINFVIAERGMCNKIP